MSIDPGQFKKDIGSQAEKDVAALLKAVVAKHFPNSDITTREITPANTEDFHQRTVDGVTFSSLKLDQEDPVQKATLTFSLYPSDAIYVEPDKNPAEAYEEARQNLNRDLHLMLGYADPLADVPVQERLPNVPVVRLALDGLNYDDAVAETQVDEQGRDEYEDVDPWTAAMREQSDATDEVFANVDMRSEQDKMMEEVFALIGQETAGSVLVHGSAMDIKNSVNQAAVKYLLPQFQSEGWAKGADA